MKNILINRLSILIVVLSFLPLSAYCQGIIEIQPLFDYPVAPEELESLTDKSDYLVQHFWDNFDLKSKTAVDQNALNDAFRVYTTPLRWANKEKSMAAVEKLITNISKSPALMIQFTKAAEENLYGPRADYWVDEIYLKFLNALLKNNKVSESQKRKYKKQFNALTNSQIDGKAPEFTFTNAKGETVNYFPMSTPTIIIFGDPSDSDWRLTRLKMETNSELTSAIEKGKINILFIVPAQIDGWINEISNYPGNWTIGVAPEIDSVIDVRAIPSCYVISSEGKILTKNASILPAVNLLLSQLNN